MPIIRVNMAQCNLNTAVNFTASYSRISSKIQQVSLQTFPIISILNNRQQYCTNYDVSTYRKVTKCPRIITNFSQIAGSPTLREFIPQPMIEANLQVGQEVGTPSQCTYMVVPHNLQVELPLKILILSVSHGDLMKFELTVQYWPLYHWPIIIKFTEGNH